MRFSKFAVLQSKTGELEFQLTFTHARLLQHNPTCELVSNRQKATAQLTMSSDLQCSLMRWVSVPDHDVCVIRIGSVPLLMAQ